MPKTCVIYQYFELNEIYKENLIHFLVFGYLVEVDFYVVICGECSIELPEIPNVFYLQTENKNRDFGGYSYAINNAVNVDKYSFFVFLNASVRGPYLPSYTRQSWTELYTDSLQHDIKLFGSTINILSDRNPVATEFKIRHGGVGRFSHVQTMSFSLGHESVKFLKHIGFFSDRQRLDDYHVVTDYEILLSQIMIRNNWTFRCLLPEYNLVDYRQEHVDINPTSNLGDVMFENAYFGRTIHPYEVVFFKMNRQLYPNFFLRRLTFSLASAGIPLPNEFRNSYIKHYISSILSGTDFQSELPSERHRVSAKKLDEIINSINLIMTRRNDM